MKTAQHTSVTRLEHLSHCPLCGNTAGNRIFSKKDKFSISEESFCVESCPSCHLVFANPRPSESEIGKYYPSFYSWKEEKDERAESLGMMGRLEKFYRFHVLDYESRKLVRLTGKSSGRLLDVGCGTGDRLVSFRKLGFEAFGVETSDNAKYAKNKLGFDVFQGDLLQAKYPDNFFDVVTLYNVLEHLHYPELVLKEIKRILKDDGYLVIQVPNKDSLQSRVLGRKWAAYDLPRHLFHFDPKTLTRMLEQTDLKTKVIDHSHSLLHPPTLVISLFPKLDPQKSWECQARGKASSHLKLLWGMATLLLAPIVFIENLLKKSSLMTAYAMLQGRETTPKTLALAGQTNLKVDEITYDAPEWIEFLKDYDLPIFYHPEWQRILEKGYGIEVKTYVLKEKDVIKIGITASMFNFMGFKLFHGNTPYGGFVGDLSYVSTFVGLLQPHLEERGVCQIRITQLSDQVYQMPPSYHLTQDYQHVLDIGDIKPEDVVKKYKKSVHRNLRKAAESGAFIREAKNLEEVDIYYEIYQETMKRNKSYGPQTRGLYRSIFSELVPQKKAVFLVVEYSGEIIAGIVLVFSKDSVYLIGNSSKGKFLHLRPNDLAFHSAIELTRKKNFRYFDFMTTGKQYNRYRQLTRFKEKWGAQRYAFNVHMKNIGGLKSVIWRMLWWCANLRIGNSLARGIYNYWYRKR